MGKVPETHFAARRFSILAAAIDLFARKGTRRATMADIAGAVGISPGAIYRYFPNKEALVRECLETKAAEAAEQFRAASHAPDPKAAFLRCSREAFTGIFDPERRNVHILNLEHVLDVARSGDRGPWQEHEQLIRGIIASMADALRQILRDAPTERAIHAVDVDALAEAFLYAYYGAIVMYLRDERTDVMQSCEALIGLLDAALMPAEEHSSAGISAAGRVSG